MLCCLVHCEPVCFQFALPTLRLEGLDVCLVFPGVLCVLAHRRGRNAGSGSEEVSGLECSGRLLLATAPGWEQCFTASACI